LVVFNVYEPPNASGDPADRALGLVFVKDGFYWLAAIFPAVWLLVKRLWLELIIFLCAIALLTWGLEAMGATSTLSGMVLLIVQIVFGFEAGAVQTAALERRGWRLVGTVTGRNRAECERRFLETWLRSPPEAPPPQHGVSSWTETAVRNAKGAMLDWRRRLGAKA